MSADRIYVGCLDVAKLARFISFDARPYQVASFEAVPQFNATVGAWVCKIQTASVGVPKDFPVAKTFTSAILRVADRDMGGVDSVFFTTTTVGSSGLVEIWAILKG